VSGHGEKLSRKKEQAILALLLEPTVAGAAASARVSTAALRRWLKTPDFQASYHDARRQTFDTALARLTCVASEAVATLERNLRCGLPAAEVRAAIAVIELGIKGLTLTDVQERLGLLERSLGGHDGQGIPASAATRRGYGGAA
jgi:hypothetical protein